MTTPSMLYPVRPKSWFERHLVMVLCVGGALFVALVVAGVIGIFWILAHSTPAAMALEKAQHSRAVIAHIGEPIHRGRVVSGNINTNGSSGRAELSFPIIGPQGEAVVYVSATRTDDVWTLKTLQAAVKGTDDRIDLLNEESRR